MKFMDFCAGIGGGRLGLEKNSMTCVGFSEIDTNAEKSYRLFYGDKEKNFGDLMEINPKNLPDFDLLIGGFPCQTFSVLGKRLGFNDKRGQIIYGLLNILKEKQVPYFILENVKGLVGHNKGETIKTIINELNNLDYYVDYKVLNSCDFGVPQLRERVYLVGIKNSKLNTFFNWPNKKEKTELKDFLCDNDGEILDLNNETFQKFLNNKYNKNKFDITEILKEDYLVVDTRQSDLRLYRDKIPTLRNGRHGILYVKDGKLHKLSPYEALLCQGFDKEIATKAKYSNISQNVLLSQAGNAMTVNVIEVLGNALLECING